MTIWATTPVRLVPRLQLLRWTVYELEDGSRHFVGWNVTEGEGRVSSAIQSFDPATSEGVTRSGRVYKLEGEAGINRDAEYTWHYWCAINDIATETVKNVFAEYVGAQVPKEPEEQSCQPPRPVDNNF